MTPSLGLAVSPYHLATREPAAMAALILGDRIVTLLPTPAAGTSKEAVFEAVNRSPRYLRLLESWRWSGPMWRAGVVGSEAEGEQACESLPAVYDEIRGERSLIELRPLTSEIDRVRDENPARYLDLISNDLLRGGPDPGISIPVHSALERFSAAHGMVLARGPVSSIAQRAEARLGTKVFSIGLPVLLQAGGQSLLDLRHDLEEVLVRLRRAILGMIEADGGGTAAGGGAEELQKAAAAYSREFQEWVQAGFAGHDDETGKRVVAGYVGLTCMHMPEDAVLRSSRAAVRSMSSVMGGHGARAGVAAAEQEASRPGAPHRYTIIIREMNVRPEA